MDGGIERTVGDPFRYKLLAGDDPIVENAPVLYICQNPGHELQQVTERDIESIYETSFTTHKGLLYGYLPWRYSVGHVNQGIFEKYQTKWGAT